MTQAPISDIIDKVIKDNIEDWQSKGYTDDQILEKLESVDINNLILSATDTAATDFATFFKGRMYEIELEERANAKEFSAHQEQLWGKCFAASQTMYRLSVDAAQKITLYVEEHISEEEKNEKKYSFLSLQYVHARACQEFLEILYLLRLGFADCAYARWRSMYELNCVAYFIRSHGENIAKQYYEQSKTDDQHYTWTKGAIDENGREIKIKTFNDLQKHCQMGDVWRDQYKLACFINHGSPKGTFQRLSIKEPDNIILVGQSNYGIAVPAEHSAISLHLISSIFFTLFPYPDGMVYMKTLRKWVEIIQDMYYSTRDAYFS